MKKLDVIRKANSLFIKWNAHRLVHPFHKGLLNGVYRSELSKWRKEYKATGYNDFYQESGKYGKWYNLYEAVGIQEGLFQQPVDYFEFGVASGTSFKWWAQHNKHQASRFFGFDTFEGLPEKWGPYKRGAMAQQLESLKINDPRATFYRRLFQDTILLLEQYDGKNKRLIHPDADLFSSTLFTLSQLYRVLKPGDVILFDEFAVPRHEFPAFKLFTESFYVTYEVIGAANN